MGKMTEKQRLRHFQEEFLSEMYSEFIEATIRGNQKLLTFYLNFEPAKNPLDIPSKHL